MPKLTKLEKLAVVNAFAVVATGYNLVSHTGSMFLDEEALMPGVYAGNANVTIREIIDNPSRWFTWIKDNLSVRVLRDIDFWEAVVNILGPFAAIRVFRKVKVLRPLGRTLNSIAGWFTGLIPGGVI